MVEVRGRVEIAIKAAPIGEADPSRGPFEGDLSTYGNIDLGGDICEPGCFDRSVAERGTHRTLLWQHDQQDPIGSFDVVSTEGSLRIRGSFNLDTEHGRAGYSLLRHGDIDGLSIGYNATDYSYDKDGIRHLLDVDLMEGSLVTFPMNPLARAEAKSRRLARMSRFAKCAFLAKMSDEERAEALAELDEVDREAEKPAEETSKDDIEGDKPEEESEKPAPEDEKEDPEEGSETDDEAVAMLREIGKTCSDYLAKLEG